MSTMQQVILIGYLGRDPETSYTQGGTAVTKFSVGVTETWNDKQSGQKQERTEWFNIETWGKLAEICGEYLHKGAQVFVRGKQRTDEYEKDGEKKRFTKCRADEVTFLKTNRSEGGGGGQSGGGQQRQTQQRPASSQQGFGSASSDDFSDDIPF